MGNTLLLVTGLLRRKIVYTLATNGLWIYKVPRKGRSIKGCPVKHWPKHPFTKVNYVKGEPFKRFSILRFFAVIFFMVSISLESLVFL